MNQIMPQLRVQPVLSQGLKNKETDRLMVPVVIFGVRQIDYLRALLVQNLPEVVENGLTRVGRSRMIRPLVWHGGDFRVARRIGLVSISPEMSYPTIRIP
jgi:hypothetical protein